MTNFGEETTRGKWKQVSGGRFDAEAPPGRHIWVSDGVNGYARPLAEGETAERAVEAALTEAKTGRPAPQDRGCVG